MKFQGGIGSQEISPLAEPLEGRVSKKRREKPLGKKKPCGREIQSLRIRGDCLREFRSPLSQRKPQRKGYQERFCLTGRLQNGKEDGRAGPRLALRGVDRAKKLGRSRDTLVLKTMTRSRKRDI